MRNTLLMIVRLSFSIQMVSGRFSQRPIVVIESIVKFQGSCLKQSITSFNHRNVVNLSIA